MVNKSRQGRADSSFQEKSRFLSTLLSRQFGFVERRTDREEGEARGVHFLGGM